MDETGKRLKELKVKLEQDMLEAKKSSQPVKLDQQAVGRISRVDAIQQQQMQLAARKRLENRIAMVTSAIGRVDRGEYGLCLECEEPIDKKRLEAKPEATLCFGCAQNRN